MLPYMAAAHSYCYELLGTRLLVFGSVAITLGWTLLLVMDSS